MQPADSSTPLPSDGAVGRRFCGRCGQALRDGLCSGCAVQPALSSRSEDKGPASLRVALALYFTLLFTIIASVAAGWFMEDDGFEVKVEIYASGAICLVAMAGVALSWARVRPALATQGPLWCYAAAPVIGLATFAIASAACYLLVTLVGLEDQSYSVSCLNAGYTWPFVIALIAVPPAIFEELAFRGVIGSAMEGVFEAREAILVTAMMFAILHLSPASFPHLFVVGLALGVLRRASGSLYPCMILHFTHNGLVLLSEYLGETSL